MADWVSSGSYQDLSKGIFSRDPISVLVPTSQEGGNMQASNEEAMTAPGSVPVDIMQPAGSYFSNDPTVTPSDGTAITPGTDGKPPARGEGWVPPGKPAWGRTTVPGITRKAVR
jgi:hypothetical protein